jgi:pimeloyl-ACP methyl ester carboxylesterase
MNDHVERAGESARGLERELETAQAALLARFAPETRVHRVRWSQGETQVLELGSGSPVLLVHGGGDCALEWVPILAELARDRRVLAVDRPGHGLADPFDYRGVNLLQHAHTFLKDVLDALDLPRVDLVGSSMGGAWSVIFASEYPERVARLVLVGHLPGVNRAVPLPLRMMGLPLLGRPLARLILSSPTRESSRKFWGQILVAHPEKLHDAFLDADVAHTRRNAKSILGLIRSAVGVWGLRRGLLLTEHLEALTMPTAFVCGEQDAFVTPGVRKAWEALGARNKNLQLVGIPGAGHIAWLDEPDHVVGEIDRFLGTASSQRPSVSGWGSEWP